ncbi:serine hydrolase domain-containing protein [Martelella sp. HB161492]|uniref:serine hydrolase domain-containing protein n=1 Tax=Martelella sp. HB161492 TaxID=2720726 RepID=UPI00158FA01A|nr:serine hydrolase domain-containing protein [Martelella sp. HB161492]
MSFETRLDAVIDDAIAQKRIVGATVLFARGGELLFQRAAGFADREAGAPAAPDTIYRLASVTKPVVATTALAMVDAGMIALDDRVCDLLPWFQPKGPDGAPADIRIRHLLTHTSGLDYTGGAAFLPKGEAANSGLTDTDLGFEENFARLNDVPLNFAPGSAWAYSVAIDILGALIAHITGETLEAAVVKYVTGPLGMTDTRFSVTDEARLATPYADHKPEPVKMRRLHSVADRYDQLYAFSPGRIFNPKAFQSGGAGMAGTAGDLLSLLSSYVLPSSTLLKPETARSALQNQTAPEAVGPGTGFGFIGSVVTNAAANGKNLPDGAVTWGGVYGNCWSIDPTSGTVGVIMTNTAMEGCNGAFPDDIWKAFYSA